MKLETFSIPIVLPIFTLTEVAVWFGFFVLNIALAFVYFYIEAKYQEKIGFGDRLNFKFNLKIIPITILFFILGPAITILSLIAIFSKKIRHKNNPPEEVIARFENDI